MPSVDRALSAVLENIDANLDDSLERLFSLLRIASISTDPAYAAYCREAAEHLAGDLAGSGFESAVRATAGHPVVVAKGAGFVAARIREIARQHGISIVENKPVARTLFKLVDIGREVPADLYRAVAEILAFVYRVRGHVAPRLDA